MSDLTWKELPEDLANTDLSVLDRQEIDQVAGGQVNWGALRTFFDSIFGKSEVNTVIGKAVSVFDKIRDKIRDKIDNLHA